jgi:DNA-binding response OmpR family regulator
MNPSEPIPANILIVDDEPNNLSILRQLLSAHGYKVRPILSGELALQAVKSVIPDLILLDIMMPEGKNGFEVCSEIKENENLKDVPIIFLSALDDTENKVRAFQIGGVDYITKPFKQEEVLTRVKTHLMLHQTQKALTEKNRHLQEMNDKLQQALEEIKTLRGILPICCNCKKIRDDQGYWNQIEKYISDRTDADFSHGLCPACVKELYPELNR